MTDEEIIIAGKKWGALKRSYGKEPFDGEVELASQCFEPYTLEEVDEAMTEYMSEGKFAPVPADIIEIIKRRRGVDKASLEIAADKWFNDFVNHVNFRCDNVTTDERAVAAFYITFGSLTHFGQLSSDADKTESYKASFRRTYVNVSETDIRAAGNVIRAEIYPQENTVHLLGNRKEAKALLPVLFPGKHLIINNDPDRQAKLAPPEVRRPVTEDERRQVLEQVDKVLNMFKEMCK